MLIFLGFAGNAFKQSQEQLLKPGQELKVGAFTVRYDGLTVTDDGQKQMITGKVTAFKDGALLAQMQPARWFFRKHEDQPTTEVAIHRSFAEDLYIVLAGYDMQTQAATFQVHVNPLVDWIWFGFGILAFGTGIALLPESAFAFAAAKVPAGAATAGLLLLFLLAPAAPARAQQHGDTMAGPTAPQSALEKKMRHELVCVCGDCPHYSLTDCLCPVADKMRAQLAEQVKLGKNDEQIKAWFVATYGSEEPLGAPIDRGFNRLAWLFPYMLGGAGALLALGVAVRWSHRERPAQAPAASAAGVDPALQAQLDDELRDLD